MLTSYILFEFVILCTISCSNTLPVILSNVLDSRTVHGEFVEITLTASVLLPVEHPSAII